ncbi:MAG: hydantoinase B/oxoprolinase family protein [Proteobacteria bacterium]|nr:hydantoinase B/oxoprolinase family protein [Pseudomonadota bacterium]
MSDIDPISRDVFQHQVHGIAEEMSMALRRAAFSSIIWDMYDYSCGLFSPEGEMLSQAETIPAQLGIMSTAIRYMFAKIPRDQWKPGDIIVCNDPYQGCTHTPDVCLFSPVFHDGELIALTSTIAHHVDIGGKVPGSEGPDNMEVFAEGLILPPLKLIEEGRPNQAIFDILAANVRDPRGSAGDLRAQIAGCRTGERRLAELAGRYGNARFREMCNACLAYNETYMRRAIAALGDGRWEAEVFMEDDVTSKEPMRLHAVVTVAGEEITIDVSGSEPQRANGMNCPEASTLSMIHYAVKCVLAPDLPQNQGCDRPVHVVTKKGTLLDPIRPAAVSVRHITQQAMADVVLKALAPVAGNYAAAGCHTSFPSFVLGGFDTRPEMAQDDGSPPYFVIADIIGGGMGGAQGQDGMNAIDSHGGNCAILSAEVMETLSPVRVRRTALVPGSGGKGRFRGGLGIERDYELVAGNGILTGYCQQTRTDTAPWGLEGGEDGGLAALIRNPGTPKEASLGSKMVGILLHEGDVLRTRGAGGGGWGDPAERDPAHLERDRVEGYA